MNNTTKAMQSRAFFRLEHIERALQRFQDGFGELNARLCMQREPFTSEMRSNILNAYAYLNHLLGKDIDLFTPAGLHCMLELNHIVLCGTKPSVRFEYHNHILSTRARYQENIRPIRNWVLRRTGWADPYRLATGFYVRGLSQPQLFIEGNQRTGNIIINYILLGKAQPPFIITPEKAKPYLDWSGQIKMSQRSAFRGNRLSTIAVRRQLQEFLRRNVQATYLQPDEARP